MEENERQEIASGRAPRCSTLGTQTQASARRSSGARQTANMRRIASLTIQEKKEKMGKKGKSKGGPMIRDTIFSPSFGNRPTYLVGREKLVDDIIAGLHTAPGSRERAVILLGQRGMGKTVLLWELADRARAAGFIVATPTVASADMPERIIEKLQDDGERALKDKQLKLSGASLGALGFSAGLQFTREVQESKSFQYKLTHLARRSTELGRGLLILIDELQANSEEIRQLVVAYQEMVGEGLNVAMAMAGLPGAVSATLNDKVLTFLNRAKKSDLGPLPLGDVDAFLARAFADLGVEISEDGRIRASRFTAGSPYLLQLVGHHMVIRTNEAGELTDTEITTALAMAQEEFENDICKTSLAALSETDRAFLKAMISTGAPYKTAHIAEHMGVTTDYAQKYRRRLIGAGVIEAAGRGMVAFAVPYLEDHLAHEA